MKKNIFILSVLFFLCCCNNNSSSQSSNENTNEDIWMSGALFSLNEVPQVTDYFVLTDGYWTCSHIIETEESVTEKNKHVILSYTRKSAAKFVAAVFEIADFV